MRLRILSLAILVSLILWAVLSVKANANPATSARLTQYTSGPEKPHKQAPSASNQHSSEGQEVTLEELVVETPPVKSASVFRRIGHGFKWLGRAAIGAALWIGLEGQTNERNW
jgi:hypothetical protein